MAEAKKNPIVTLKAQAKKFDFSKLRAEEDNKGANSGVTMYGDFHRMNFVINKKIINETSIHTLIERAWKQYSWRELKHSLIDKGTNAYGKKLYSSEEQVSLLKEEVKKNNNYRPIAKEIFKEMFQYAKATVPSNSILEELVTNCNQSSYYGGGLVINVLAPALFPHELMLQSQGTIHINCTNRNCVSIKSDNEMSITDTKLLTHSCDPEEAVICQLNNSLEFTLESQDGKDGVTYKDGKLSLTIPKELKSYQDGGKSLFDVIKEYFQKFCEKLGLKFEAKIKQNLRKQLKVDSHLESVKPPAHINQHVHDN
ncbi:MAG: hypothetical protein LJD31_02700 [Wolbachia endosymbiont of Menacanthus eurysternus]|nr:hypothetical protein [Wolbachia endosymbiont of Menacanthus eurysternus]